LPLVPLRQPWTEFWPAAADPDGLLAVAEPDICPLLGLLVLPLVEPAVWPLVSEPLALVDAGLLLPEVWAPVWSELVVEVWLLVELVDVDVDEPWSCAIATAAPNSKVAIVTAIFFIVSSSRKFL
jgi:hypothetical protein